MPNNYLVAGCDWTPHWVKTVVVTDNGAAVARAIWPRDEAEDHLLRFLCDIREKHGMPVLVTGRCRAPWPEALLSRLILTGFAYDLFDGPPLGSMLRQERRDREDMAYRPAALLAAIHLAGNGLQDWRAFVARWSLQQAYCHTDELANLLSSREVSDQEEAVSKPTFPHRVSIRPAGFRGANGNARLHQTTLF